MSTFFSKRTNQRVNNTLVLMFGISVIAGLGLVEYAFGWEALFGCLMLLYIAGQATDR